MTQVRKVLKAKYYTTSIMKIAIAYVKYFLYFYEI